MRDSGSRALVFLKLGGSLLSDKRRERSFRAAVIVRLAGEIASALEKQPDMRLLLAHGAGGFGHFPAKKYRTREGLPGGGGWRGFAETRRAMADLSGRMLDALDRGGLRPVLVSPCAGVIARGGKALRWDLRVIRSLLNAGQVPLIHGDAVLDERLGFTILSTEELFTFLAARLHPERIILACDVKGVYLAGPHRPFSRADDRAAAALVEHGPKAGHVPRAVRGSPVARVDRANIAEIRRVLRAADGQGRADVTGGMFAKVERLYRIARRIPGLDARIVSGLSAGTVASALTGGEAGTAIC